MIEQILNPKILNALGWTLIHSLWQVAAVAVFLALVLLVLRKSSARLRYNISIGSLLVCFTLFISTFVYFFINGNVTEKEVVVLNEIETEVVEILIQNDLLRDAESTNQSNFTNIFYDYFNTNLPLVVTLWFLGLTLFVIRFLGGLAYIQRLKHSNHNPLNEEWEMVLQEVKGKLNINKTVDLVESSLVHVPMVIGYLKPMILMPIGAINYLTVEEVEAIFAHELAHIKRYDYFVNLLQSIIETILFYHPAIWWISSEIRRERENCCDDLALEVTGNSLTLAKALAKLEQYRMNFINQKIQLSMTALKNKNQLLQRIQRILKEPQSNNSTLKGLFAGVILVICFFATSLDAQEKPTVPVPAETQKIEIPTAPRVSFPERENTSPKTPEAVPKPSTPVVPITPISPIAPTAPLPPAAPTAPIAPIPPIPSALPADGLKSIQPAQPVQPNAPKGFTTFSFTPDKPELVYVQLHNEQSIRRINTKDIDEISVLRDTSIEGETKEIIIVKEVKEANEAAKEVKISIKKINGKEKITIYENGRKLSEKEAEKYKSNDQLSNNLEIEISDMEGNMRRVEAANLETAMEMKRLEREMKAEERRILAEERKILAEERKVMAEESKRLVEEEVRMKQEMERSRFQMKEEMEKMKKERIQEMERFKEEQEKMRLESERLHKEAKQKSKEKSKMKSKDASGNSENFGTAINGWTAVEDLERTIGVTNSNTKSTSITTSTTTVSGVACINNDWFDEFLAVLRKDDLLEKNEDNIRIKISENFMRINGKSLSKGQANTYYKLYEKLSGTKINGELEIRKRSKK